MVKRIDELRERINLLKTAEAHIRTVSQELEAEARNIISSTAKQT